jgi:DNA-binding transcriptional MerR regulator
MDDHAADSGRVRIGELSHRVGVSPELLRAWERRYGLFAPLRTAGGFRLYGDEDERRARLMVQNLAGGLAAAEAARLVRSGPAGATEQAAAPDDAAGTGQLAAELRAALDRFDEEGAQAAFDRLLAGFSLDAVLRDAVLPYLRELGDRWVRGEASIAQEHFASAVLRGRLLGLARGWGAGAGPLGLLACLPGEQHDLALICFGLALRGRGWRIAFLGPDTPLATLGETATLMAPALVVAGAALAHSTAGARDGLREIASRAPLALAGAGVTAALAQDIGALHLAQDPVTAAAAIAAGALATGSRDDADDR